MKYYTYCYLGLNNKPYYIGKGSGDRAYVRHTYCDLPDRERIIILKRDLSEEEAFKHEIYMIDVFGLKVNTADFFCNRSRGGGRNAGWTHTEEAKRKASVIKIAGVLHYVQELKNPHNKNEYQLRCCRLTALNICSKVLQRLANSLDAPQVQ